MSMTSKQAAFVVTLSSVIKAMLVEKYGEESKTVQLITIHLRPMLDELELLGVAPVGFVPVDYNPEDYR